MTFCHWTILDSVIICISSIQNALDVKDTTDFEKSVFFFDFHLEIDTGERLKTKLYDKRDYLTFTLCKC